MFHFCLHYDDVGHQIRSGYFLFIFRRWYTFNAYENLRVIVGSKSEKFKNMETALKLKIKHLYNRERVLMYYLREIINSLSIQMMKLRPWINLKIQSQWSRDSSVPQKSVFQYSRERYIENFLGASPQTPICRSESLWKNIYCKNAKAFNWTSTYTVCPQIQFSCLWACYFLPCQSFILYNYVWLSCSTIFPEFHYIKHGKFIGHAHLSSTTLIFVSTRKLNTPIRKFSRNGPGVNYLLFEVVAERKHSSSQSKLD